MTSPSRFDTAYQAWQADPVQATNANRLLWDQSQSAVHAQEFVADVLHTYRQTGTAPPPPIDLTPEQWNSGASYLIARSVRSARRMLQTGRHQVATRQLLTQTEKLKEVWDAYRAATGS